MSSIVTTSPTEARADVVDGGMGVFSPKIEAYLVAGRAHYSRSGVLHLSELWLNNM
jgi:hypothetical protein